MSDTAPVQTRTPTVTMRSLPPKVHSVGVHHVNADHVKVELYDTNAWARLGGSGVTLHADGADMREQLETLRDFAAAIVGQATAELAMLGVTGMAS